ncbi:hypothetical protein B0T19DRAFT_397652 [Cercophora scortea]|uniref:Uncharacterized protein n=1 Tax=Cercophora scortea TaxID=314031 RepID=A0AAE0IVN9_9PEZI|nr:hypothetical protein B0T19DRAFT_397652 [Cercophora scortea]
MRALRTVVATAVGFGYVLFGFVVGVSVSGADKLFDITHHDIPLGVADDLGPHHVYEGPLVANSAASIFTTNSSSISCLAANFTTAGYMLAPHAAQASQTQGTAPSLATATSGASLQRNVTGRFPPPPVSMAKHPTD